MPCIFRPSESKETVGVSPPSREKQVQVHGRESTGVPRTGKAQGLHHYRGLHQLRRLCGGLPPAGHHLGRAQRHPPGALPPLRQLRGALPRGGRYTKGAGDRPSGNLTKGSCGLLAEEGFFFGSVNRKSIFLARPIYGFHWNMFWNVGFSTIINRIFYRKNEKNT